MATFRRVPDSRATLTDVAWSCCGLPPAAIAGPPELAAASCAWFPAAVPGTVASALAAEGKWDHQHPVDIDSLDWWYRATFPWPVTLAGEPCFLCCDGLASQCEVWLNGEHILSTDNMFRHYRVNVAGALGLENELVLVFRSLTAELQRKRPRPRWKTNLVNHQQLRWHRTSLLGRIPGWTPPVPAVGPWRDVRIEHGPVLLGELLRTVTMDEAVGVVKFRTQIDASVPIKSARMLVGDQEESLQCTDAWWQGEVRVAEPELWWPHTHGTARLYDCKVVVESEAGLHEFELERIGFRKLARQDEPGFALHINDQPVYCRGACWTTSDIFTLTGKEDSLRRDLELARAAGMNMVRVGGTMVYESDAFYRLCDELGILVWQDFMFANMDYPVGDAAFAENITTEAQQQLDRLALHPCVVVYCGNSEIEQQAAMLGMPRELWRNEWFHTDLPALCQQRHPGTTYVPSTPSGGVLPFHVRTGISHFYGIGAYLRSVRELRQADVKFTTECLGFANLPEPDVIDEIMGGLMPVVHHPRWKQRVPRDTGSAWDFEDVRDHYLRELFQVDPATLRSFDMPRYLELSRLTPGEMMARTFAEWRSGPSRNAGALVWFFKDLWAASGWGILDHHGQPKAPYYQLKRAWQTRQLTVTDEGLDGLHLHLTNETSEPVEGFLAVQLLREPNMVTSSHELPITIGPRSQQTLSVDEIIASFHDVNYAYRFGPQVHHVVIATWCNAQREALSEAFHLTRTGIPDAYPLAPGALTITVAPRSEGQYEVTLKSDRFLHGVRLSASGFLPDDNYFYLQPARLKHVIFTPFAHESRPFRLSVEALNLPGELTAQASVAPH